MKKILSTLIIFSMLFSMLTLTSFAYTVETGKCGHYITYEIKSDGELILKGRGKTFDYETFGSFDYVPFKIYSDKIFTITVSEGIEHLGSYLFAYLKEVRTLSLPDSLEFIDNIRLNSSNIDSLEIPSGVKYIGDNAFIYCKNLRNVVLPENIKYIGDNAFPANSLSINKIPEKIEYIGNNAFKGSNLSEVKLPETVEYIGEGAFDDTPFMNSQPDGLIYIDNFLVSVKGKLPFGSRIEIKEGTEKISEFVFENQTGLLSVSVPGSVKALPDYVFYGCSNLTEISLSKGLEKIGNSAFRECKNISQLYIPDTVEYIDKRAFMDCEKLSYFRFPEGIKTVNDEVLKNCLNLENVIMPEKNKIEYFGSDCFENTYFYNCQPYGFMYLDNVLLGYKGTMPYNTHLNVKEGTRVIADGAFMKENFEILAFNGYEELSGVTLPEGLISVGREAFAGCKNLGTVKIPSSLKNIGYAAFYWYPQQGDIIIPENNSLENIEKYCFNAPSDSQYYKNLMLHSDFYENDEICKIEEGTEIISGYLFHTIYELSPRFKYLTVPESVKKISKHTFDICTDMEKAVIKGRIKVINEWTFLKCCSLKTIYLPSTLEEIKEDAFRGCYNLSDIYFDGTKEQWDKIIIAEGNGFLEAATVHYKGENYPGDIDGDTDITSSDARTALRYSVSLENLTPEQINCADVDKDGSVTASDARKILRASVNLEII